MPEAPTGWPFDLSPPDVLIGLSPSLEVLPSSTACGASPGLHR